VQRVDPAAEPSDEVRVGVAWRDLRRGAAASAVRERLLAASGFLELGQLDALDLLAHHGALRMGDLAEALRVDASTATRSVDRLVDAGLAERSADPADGRRVVVRASDKGQDLQAELAERRLRMLERMLQGFSAEERSQLAGLMERFVQALDELVAEEDW
jgi:DNA-binding MarR family transcriptional regulator